MNLHDLVGSTLIASDRDTDSFFFWDDKNSVFLVQNGQVQQTLQAGSLTDAHQAVAAWKKTRELRKQVDAFLWYAMKGYESFLWDLQEESGLVRVRYRNKDDTATETVVASDWSEMLAKLRERFS